MTLSKLVVRTEESYLELFRVYKLLKKYRTLKKYKIPDLLLSRFFDLKTTKIASELENKSLKLFKEKIKASVCQKELTTLLNTPEKMVLQPEGSRVW